MAESIRRLRDEDSVSAQSEENSGQPPTPSSTPGPANVHQVGLVQSLNELNIFLALAELKVCVQSLDDPEKNPLRPTASCVLIKTINFELELVSSFS